MYEWYKRFQGGKSSWKGISRSASSKSLTEQNIANVRDLFKNNLRIKVKEIASKVGISYGSVETITVNELEFRKISTCCVSCFLINKMKQNRLEVSQQLLKRFQTEEENFLHHIVTGVVTWVHYYTAELKNASLEWKKKEEVALIEEKTRFFADIVRATDV